MSNVNKYQAIVGIDPDTVKSGCAYLETGTRIIEASSLAFPQLLDYLKFIAEKSKESAQTVIVVVESGWKLQSNWHTTHKDTIRTAVAKGNAVGRNHEIGRKIVECARHYGLEVIEQIPLKKCWKGRDGKITQKELAYFTGTTGTQSQDVRDAVLLAWHYAGFPIKMKV